MEMSTRLKMMSDSLQICINGGSEFDRKEDFELMETDLIHQYKENDIAIIGVAGKFPEANNLEEFWENLKQGRDSIRPIPDSRLEELQQFLGNVPKEEFAKCGYLDEISYFDPEFFMISAEEARYIDPQQRLLLELVELAIQNAGYSSQKLSTGNVGIFMASSKNTYGSLMDPTVPMALNNTIEAAIAGRIAYTFNFFGPSLTIDTACSSSLVALHYACQALRNQECDYALAGGVKLKIMPNMKTSLNLSPIASMEQKVRAFDRDADGTVGGEGGAVVLLKKANRAIADGDQIYAVIKGSAVNSDGRRSNGLSAPNQAAQADVIARAIKSAGIEPTSISYLEAHGTGTKLGDPIEVQGIGIAFSQYTDQKQYLPIGSLKTNIGHLDSAAGIANVVKVILAIQHKKIPASLHFHHPNPHIDFINLPVYVNTQQVDWYSEGVRRAGVTSLGLTGTNVHLILEESKEMENHVEEQLNMFTLSAKNQTSLELMRQEMATYLEKNQQIAFNDIAYTLNCGRNHYSHRLALIAKSREELVKKLKNDQLKNQVVEELSTFVPVFIYPDLEEMNSNLLDELAETEVIFQESVKESLSDDVIERGEVYFIYQYALSKLLISYGMKPSAVLGVGYGQYASDVIKGKKQLEAGLKQVREDQSYPQQVEDKKLRKVIEKMVADGRNLFVIIGDDSELGKRIENILQMKEDLMVFNLRSTPESLYRIICQLYSSGFPIQWENIYAQQKRWRVKLPTYVFNKQSYLLRPEALRRQQVLTPELVESRDQQEAKVLGHRQATFEHILEIFSEVVVGDINLDQDFEETGGDSISVMQIAQLIKKEYQLPIPLSLFYSTSSVRRLIEEMISLINNCQDLDEGTDGNLARENRREKMTNTNQLTICDLEDLSLETAQFDHLLLTGATGFYGIHLLRDLLFLTDAKVYCLVRGKTRKEGEQRLRDKIEYYFKDSLERYWSRIFVIVGDITFKNLKLDEDHYHELTIKIDAVVHSAGDVRHYGKYEHFEKINVQGTQYLLDFATVEKPKAFHYISTIGVGGNPTENNHLLESDLDIGQSFQGNVYGRSKFEAEKLVQKAIIQGVNASIYRVGNLVGRYEDGQFQQNIMENGLYNNLKALISLGKIPKEFLTEGNFELTPVDSCSQAMVKLMMTKALINNTYHLANPKRVSMQKFKEVINQMGYELTAVSDEEFYQYVQNQVQEQGFTRELSMIYNRLRRVENLQGEDSPQIMTHSTDFTVLALKKIGFIWPELDGIFIEKMLEYCQRIRYISKKKNNSEFCNNLA